MVTKMLEKAIEIEGLLRIIRDGNPLAETYTLLQTKADELSEGVSALLPGKEEEKVMEREIENDITTEEAEEEEQQAEERRESDFSDLSELSDLSDLHEEEEADDDILLATSEEEEIEEESEVEPRATPEPKKEHRRAKLKSAFSLNDRFLYSRELFDGDMKMFDSTLEFIEGVEDYSVIEDYFYSELEWDPENRFVASFMEILRPHFRD